jgi:CheY-like chemotaxis protein
MPKPSGFEFLARIYVDPACKDVPVVVLSTLDQPSDVQKALQFVVMAYFVKASMSIATSSKRWRTR